MRVPLFIIGLAFVANVVIVDVDAIWCYFAEGGHPHQKIDCDHAIFPYGWVGNGQCYTVDTAQGKERGCAFDVKGKDLCNLGGFGFQCCGQDLCNGDVSPNVTVAHRSTNSHVTPPVLPVRDGLQCYKEAPGVPYQKVDCEEEAMKQGLPMGTYKKCATVEVSNGRVKVTGRGCMAGHECDAFNDPGLTVNCALCSVDYCNGVKASIPSVFLRNALPSGFLRNAPQYGFLRSAPSHDRGSRLNAATSTPPVPLLIAIVASAMAALGF